MLERMQKNRNCYSLLEEMQNSPLSRTIWQLLTKLNIVLPYNSSITLLDNYLIELKSYVNNNNKTLEQECLQQLYS